MTPEVKNVRGLRFAVAENVAITPLAFSSSSGSVRGGLTGSNLPDFSLQFRGDGRGGVRATTRFRHDDSSGKFAPAEYREVNATGLYLGPLHREFGHFLTESSSRMWFCGQDLESWDSMLFLPETSDEGDRGAWRTNGPYGWRRDALEFLGVDEAHYVVDPIRIRRLIIPEQGNYLFSPHMHDLQKEFLSRNAAEKLGGYKPTRRVFFSRENFHGGRNGYKSVLGESYLSQFLAEYGYENVIPESLSLTEQIELAYETKFAIGVQGSAFHIFNLLGSTDVHALVIQRQSWATTRGFLQSLEPAVGKIVNISGSVEFPEGNFQGLILPDVQQFLTELAEFDQEVDISQFSWSTFYETVRGEISKRGVV